MLESNFGARFLNNNAMACEIQYSQYSSALKRTCVTGYYLYKILQCFFVAYSSKFLDSGKDVSNNVDFSGNSTNTAMLKVL